MSRLATEPGPLDEGTPAARADRPPADLLRTSIQRFVRSFGLLNGDQTPCGLPLSPSHAHALMALIDRERSHQRSTQQDLVKILGVDKSNVPRLCAKMLESGHLSQQPSLDDGRAWLVSLTEKGRLLAERVEAASR